VDPIYAFDAERISSRASESYETVTAQIHKNQADYVWGMIISVEELGRVRMSAMARFLADYNSENIPGRYIAAQLPSLPFATETFDIAVSHFLFLYSTHLSAEFHIQSLKEMLRVAR
jgi:hypothetical protein